MKALSLENIGSASAAAPNSLPKGLGHPNSDGREAMRLLKELAGPPVRGESVKDVVTRVSSQTGIHYWRAYDIWYEKARRVEPAEIEAIEGALKKKSKVDVRNEIADLRARLARLESMLNTQDPDFHGQAVDHAREQVRRLG